MKLTWTNFFSILYFTSIYNIHLENCNSSIYNIITYPHDYTLHTEINEKPQKSRKRQNIKLAKYSSEPKCQKIASNYTVCQKQTKQKIARNYTACQKQTKQKIASNYTTCQKQTKQKIARNYTACQKQTKQKIASNYRACQKQTKQKIASNYTACQKQTISGKTQSWYIIRTIKTSK